MAAISGTSICSSVHLAVTSTTAVAAADGVSYQYIDSTNGIEVVLAAGQVQWKDGLYTDTLRQIEWVRGTNFADTYDAIGYGGTSTNMNSSGESWNLSSPGAPATTPSLATAKRP